MMGIKFVKRMLYYHPSRNTSDIVGTFQRFLRVEIPPLSIVTKIRASMERTTSRYDGTRRLYDTLDSSDPPVIWKLAISR